MRYLWTEDTGAGFHFWKLVNQLLFDNELVVESKGSNQGLLDAVSDLNIKDNEKYYGSTPILVDKGQKGRGTASCNLPATRYIIEANPLNVLKPRAFRFAACIMELIPSQTAFVMRW